MHPSSGFAPVASAANQPSSHQQIISGWKISQLPILLGAALSPFEWQEKLKASYEAYLASLPEEDAKKLQQQLSFAELEKEVVGGSFQPKRKH